MDKTNKISLAGLKILRAISILSIIFMLILLASALSTFTALFSSFFGITDLLSMVLTIIVSALIIRGINKPTENIYKKIRLLLIIDVVLLVPSLLTANEWAIYQSVLSILFSLAAIWYLSKIKAYFITGSIDISDINIKKTDKRFKIFFIIWLVLIFVPPLLIHAVREVGSVKQTISQMSIFIGKSFSENTQYCKTMQTQDAAEECLVNLIGYTKEVEKSVINVETCDMFSSKNGKLSCYAILNRCDVLTDEKENSICKIASSEFNE